METSNAEKAYVMRIWWKRAMQCTDEQIAIFFSFWINFYKLIYEKKRKKKMNENRLPGMRRAELFRGALARVVVLNLKRAGTTLAAESLASNVITHAATIIKPIEWFCVCVCVFRSFQF